MTKLKSIIMLVTFISLSSCNSTAVKVNNDVPAANKTNAIKVAQTGKLSSSEMLAQHNIHRKSHGLPQLSWSPQLAQYAQQWAAQLQTKGCKLIHRPGQPPYGENLFYASPVRWSNGAVQMQNMTAKQVVDSWVSEKKDYSYKSNSCNAGKACGHYTQVVWKNTTQVGCAAAVCSNKAQVMVCNYNPPGNLVGQRPY